MWGPPSSRIRHPSSSNFLIANWRLFIAFFMVAAVLGGSLGIYSHVINKERTEENAADISTLFSNVTSFDSSIMSLLSDSLRVCPGTVLSSGDLVVFNDSSNCFSQPTAADIIEDTTNLLPFCDGVTNVTEERLLGVNWMEECIDLVDINVVVNISVVEGTQQCSCTEVLDCSGNLTVSEASGTLSVDGSRCIQTYFGNNYYYDVEFSFASHVEYAVGTTITADLMHHFSPRTEIAAWC